MLSGAFLGHGPLSSWRHYIAVQVRVSFPSSICLLCQCGDAHTHPVIPPGVKSWRCISYVLATSSVPHFHTPPGANNCLIIVIFFYLAFFCEFTMSRFYICFNCVYCYCYLLDVLLCFSCNTISFIIISYLYLQIQCLLTGRIPLLLFLVCCIVVDMAHWATVRLATYLKQNVASLLGCFWNAPLRSWWKSKHWVVAICSVDVSLTEQNADGSGGIRGSASVWSLPPVRCGLLP